MKLHLALTGRCNLACAYCYQDARRVRARMSPRAACEAVETVLALGPPPHSVTLSGGEPFVAPALVRRVVSAVRGCRWDPRTAECMVLTNGLLVGDGDIDFLADQDAALQVSLHGAAATRGRALGLVSRALARRPAWAGGHLSVAIVVRAQSVPTLGASVEKLLAAGVPTIRMGPLVTHDPGWTASTRASLEAQVDRVVAESVRRWRLTGAVPVELLREDPPSGKRRRGAVLCSAPSAESVAVDPDGRAWGCPSFMTSLQRVPPLGQRAAERLSLGPVLDPGFGERLARLPRSAGRVALFRDGAKRGSSRGRCHDCDFGDECFVCPSSTPHIPGSTDPHRVPDHQCDFQRATLRGRRLFREQTARAVSPGGR